MSESVPFFDLGALVAQKKQELVCAFESVIDSGMFIGGPKVSEFESQFANYLDVEFFIGVGNGLDAIRIGLEALGIGPGDEVIVPGFTFYATWLAVAQTGATPIFADVETDSANLDVNTFKELITQRTKAVIVVHLFGNPADIESICEIAKENKLFVVEDCAQAHGAEVDGQKVGTFGDIGAFSFYPTKNLGALGDAGGIATSDSNLNNVSRSKRSYGQGQTKYDHVDLGWNSRLDPVQAAFLSSHLPYLDEWNGRRREIAKYYLGQMGSLQERVIGSKLPEKSVWHHFVLRAGDRGKAANIASECGVQTDIHYPYSAEMLIPMKSFIQKSQPVNALHNSNELARSVLSFPIGPWMSDLQVEQVGLALKQISVN
jgi:dTDP-4-amino-4,6-dideoxygalactose transaminase